MFSVLVFGVRFAILAGGLSDGSTAFLLGKVVKLGELLTCHP